MADDQRTTSDALTLLEALQRSPHEFDFFQAMRLLERAYAEYPRWGEALGPADEPVRIGQDPSLAFAPSTLSSFSVSDGARPARLGVLFLGVFGPNGALPLHLSEHARHRLYHHGDTTFARFVDLFHHRLLSLFYRAWASSRPTVQHDRPETDRFAVYIATLIGRGLPALRNRDALPDSAKLFYAGRFAAQTRNAEGLAAIVGDFFEVPARIEEFMGEWIELPKDCLWGMGVLPRRGSPRMGLLGRTAMLGSRVWSVQHKFRIVLGPLGRASFRRLAPGGASVTRLVAMVRNYMGDELAWDVRLVPQSEAVQPLQLGSSQLGWTTWLVRDSERLTHWEDLIFDPQALSTTPGPKGKNSYV
jgi:type VI secretion system protein ImpH